MELSKQVKFTKVNNEPRSVIIPKEIYKYMSHATHVVVTLDTNNKNELKLVLVDAGESNEKI